MNGRGPPVVRHAVLPLPPQGSGLAVIPQAYPSSGPTHLLYRDRSSSGGVGSSGSSGGGGREAVPPSPPSPRPPGAASHPSGSNFKVVIRARPPLPRELNGERPFVNVVSVRPGQAQQITVSEDLAAALDDDGDVRPAAPAHTFTFDYVYDQDSTQQSVYDNTARGVVDSSLAGYNATIFAYGQTGTGKTYTMEGYHAQANVEERGIIPRAIEQIFGFIAEHASPRMRFLVRASYLQIYNEQISDLLKPERSNLAIREDKKRGVFVEGLSEWVVRSPAEIYGLMERGAMQRRVGSTNMNEKSSRSHAVFIIIAEQSHTTYVDNGGKEMTPEEFSRLMHVHGVNRQQLHSRLEPFLRQSFKVGKLNLVDLAGSERVRLSGATGQRLEESKKINQSLSALGNVIAALTDARGRNHIPYRDSKLTRILEDSLGGNCRTTMMAMISPALEALQESLSTLKFANRAKHIKNEAKINEDVDQKSLLRKYERELKRLRAELEERSRNVVDKRRLLELDEQRRRAEADKMTAIRALEARSLEFMHEKEEKKKLEDKILALTSQVIHDVNSGSAPGAATAGTALGSGAGAGVLSEVSERLRHEYEGRLQELEKERFCIEEEKAQVERYKQLLLKQRDIMIALTQRLNERDEQIMALQDELDGYDKARVLVEEKLDEKTAELIHLQRVTLEQAHASPVKNAQLVDALGAWGSKDGAAEGAVLSRLEVAAMAKELAAVRADKALLEASLRGNLEAGVAREVAARQTSTGPGLSEGTTGGTLITGAVAATPLGASPHVERLEAENRELKASALALAAPREAGGESEPLLRAELAATAAALRRAESARAEAEAAARAAAAAAEVEAARAGARGDVLVKERKAVQTILELKVQVLVNEVARAAQDVLQGNTAAVATLGKELSALQRLVGASIQALRNAQAEDDLREHARASS